MEVREETYAPTHAKRVIWPLLQVLDVATGDYIIGINESSIGKKYILTFHHAATNLPSLFSSGWPNLRFLSSPIVFTPPLLI